MMKWSAAFMVLSVNVNQDLVKRDILHTLTLNYECVHTPWEEREGLAIFKH